MKILTIPINYGLSKPISGGQNRFSNLVLELKKRSNGIILFGEKHLISAGDENNAKIYHYKQFKIFNRTFGILRDFNYHFALGLLNIFKNEDIDLIQITHPSGIITIQILKLLTGCKAPIVYDAHNVESNFIKEMYSISEKYSWLESFLTYHYTYFLEKTMCKYFVNHVTAVSEVDKNTFTIKYCLNPENITAIPSGCKISYPAKNKPKDDLKLQLGLDQNKIVVFFHGSHHHPPNQDAANEIINYIAPEFQKTHKDILFLIGGNGFPVFEKDNIKSVGFIESLEDVLSTADIAIVPLNKGAGTKLKMFDYFSSSLPVVTTKKGIEGIDANYGNDVLVVDNVGEDFITAIQNLIENESERKRIGKNARILAERKYDWALIGDKLDKLYSDIVINSKK